MKHCNEQKAGIIAAVGAYILWGVLPIYWKFLNHVPAQELLAHRIVWSFVFVSGLLVVTGKVGTFFCEVREIIANWRRLTGIVLASLLISVNWLIYIWAVNDNRILETSLGYYINPLVSVILGIAVLSEKLSFWQTISFALAAAGVFYMAAQFGSLPWVAIALAITFALYGLCKKMVGIGAVTSITLETLIVSPVAMAFLIYLHQQGGGSFTEANLIDMLLFAGTGLVTATPLLLFSAGANKLPLKVLGFLQYLAPTIALLIGVFLYHESFTVTHFISFGCIWLALTVFSLSGTKLFKQMEARIRGEERLDESKT